jgi:peptidoglycan hydrolase CwlO-like protein
MRRPRGIPCRAGGAQDVIRRARSRAWTAVVLVVLTVAPVAAFPVTTTEAAADSVTTLTESIDDVAEAWFAAQADVQRLDVAIAGHEQRIADLEARAGRLEVEATRRAVDLYVGESTPIVEVFSDATALDSARRVELIGRANEHSSQTFDALTELTNELKSQRDALERQRRELRVAVDALQTNRATLDAQLDDARRAAADAAERRTRARAQRTSTGGGGDTAAPAPPPAAEREAAPAEVVVAAPPATTGVHPMHDHPFLVCTRSRESRGIYTIVSASGLYYGAYQFLRETWDVTALHAGRPELVGVLPNTASEYDQDDLAWALYQWQGNDPWGGRC